MLNPLLLPVVRSTGGTGSSLSDVLHDSSVNSTCTCTSLMFHVVMSAVHVVVVEQLPRVLLSDSLHVHVCVPVYKLPPFTNCFVYIFGSAHSRNTRKASVIFRE